METLTTSKWSKPRSFKINSKIAKLLLILAVIGGIYLGIMYAANSLNEYLFNIYNIDHVSFK